ncbi:hypothetical protein ACO0K3_12935 [Undibacterium sp. Rencai35W]|uniref:hypothetical protein n=1 Tax=Undibacterium sp. Rencai35W TaxID=3413046 RepID=UPI003BF196E3
MDKKLSRNNKEKVLRRLEALLQQKGFLRNKSMYFIRTSLPHLEYIHLHHVTTDTSFRITMGMHIVDDAWNTLGLNDLVGEQYRSALDSERTNVFQYAEDEHSVTMCAKEIFNFVENVIEPWYQSMRNHAFLMSYEDSLYTSKERDMLSRSIALDTDVCAVG